MDEDGVKAPDDRGVLTPAGAIFRRKSNFSRLGGGRAISEQCADSRPKLCVLWYDPQYPQSCIFVGLPFVVQFAQ